MFEDWWEAHKMEFMFAGFFVGLMAVAGLVYWVCRWWRKR